MLKGKKIVLGITGSIAAYKACLIIRGLIKQGAEVQVVITPAGKEFITPITLSALTHKPVISEFFSQRDGTWNSHVDIGLWADAMLVAPATASTIGKMAHGVADNMLITTYLSMKAPVFIAPAMDLDMYAHPSTQANLRTLQEYGNHIIEPQSGFLASGLEGKGRMEEPDVIVEALSRFFDHQAATPATSPIPSQQLSTLASQHILITAGPTYEKIDPVRFIGNYSSGKMGFALAEECAARGAQLQFQLAQAVLVVMFEPEVHVSVGLQRVGLRDMGLHQVVRLVAHPASLQVIVLSREVVHLHPGPVVPAGVHIHVDVLHLYFVQADGVPLGCGGCSLCRCLQAGGDGCEQQEEA